jgi:hypothetical protein
LAISTIGWPSAMARLSWIEDILQQRGPASGNPRLRALEREVGNGQSAFRSARAD